MTLRLPERFSGVTMLRRGRRGTTFRAMDSESSAPVVVKVYYRLTGPEDELLRARLMQWATCSIETVPSPEILLADGSLVTVVPWLDGARSLEDMTSDELRLQPGQLAAVGCLFGETLMALHGQGLVFGAGSPADLMLVKAPGRLRPVGWITEPGLPVPSTAPSGRIQAPELSYGHPADALSDQYSLASALIPLASDPESMSSVLDILARAAQPRRAARFADLHAFMGVLVEHAEDLEDTEPRRHSVPFSPVADLDAETVPAIVVGAVLPNEVIASYPPVAPRAVPVQAAVAVGPARAVEEEARLGKVPDSLIDVLREEEVLDEDAVDTDPRSPAEASVALAEPGPPLQALPAAHLRQAGPAPFLSDVPTDVGYDLDDEACEERPGLSRSIWIIPFALMMVLLGGGAAYLLLAPRSDPKPAESGEREPPQVKALMLNRGQGAVSRKGTAPHPAPALPDPAKEPPGPPVADEGGEEPIPDGKGRAETEPGTEPLVGRQGQPPVAPEAAPSGWEAPVVELPADQGQEPGEQEDPGVRARRLNTAGFQNYRRKRYKEALHYYLLAIRSDPEYSTPHYNAACMYAMMGETRDAIRHLNDYLRYLSEPVDVYTKVLDDQDFHPILNDRLFQTWLRHHQHR